MTEKKFSLEESILIQNLIKNIEEDDRRIEKQQKAYIEKPVFKN
ncbi:hypothetical protein [Pseudobacteriovorax antillogorgiicola]|uniref:Uncharacterized protein n=1 Tax=Pseudobacteriovorax antillogorgiicola TaxID=1513793 RepID=A0A1Y6CKA5_9BACT|nr:hypothetical protein [Pseudobacteriovorax antillogorgiicola]TCS45623.1 hypothetical protein EDD56_12715 [Pseudobacteriovorax antillogorgiicola]SMF72452.1 hypothetical protein SAMN06296036_12714 [Pseudobacteriovorax antillogorgiicola]